MKNLLSDPIAPGIALLVMVSFAVLGLPEWLGAHRWWATNVVVWGSALGALLWWVGARFAVAALVPSVLLVGLGAMAARFGKAAFVASYAENALAGRFWFFGWITLCAGVFWTVAVLARRSKP
ncbi:hypothetical protein [Marivivens marinus]|uniref:hypothetical protein n=1 Tax=Marivivens marinus TaxID=3110173 RepID=UPI003B8474E2